MALQLKVSTLGSIRGENFYGKRSRAGGVGGIGRKNGGRTRSHRIGSCGVCRRFRRNWFLLLRRFLCEEGTRTDASGQQNYRRDDESSNRKPSSRSGSGADVDPGRGCDDRVGNASENIGFRSRIEALKPDQDDAIYLSDKLVERRCS